MEYLIIGMILLGFILGFCYFTEEKKVIPASRDFIFDYKEHNDNVYYDPVNNELIVCNSIDYSHGRDSDFGYKKGYFASDIDERWMVVNVREVSKYTEYIGSLGGDY